jgi:hypothetical protein
MIIILDLSELNNKFKKGLFFPINDYVPFEEVVLSFLQDHNDPCMAIWNLLEDCQIVDFSKLSDSRLKAIDLMSQIFHEALINYTALTLGVSVDDIIYDFGMIDETAFYLRV